METANVLGDTVSTSKVDKLVTQLSEGSVQSINQVVNEAIKCGWQLVMVVDDYTVKYNTTTTNNYTYPKKSCVLS